MNLKRVFVVGLLLLVWVATPVLALAQDGDKKIEVDTSDWETFTSEDEIFTVLYPPDWAVAAGESPGSVTVANSEDLLKTFESNDPAAPGEKVVAVFALFPMDLLGLLGVNLEKDATAEDLISGIATALMSDTSSEDDTKYGDTGVLKLSDDVEVGTLEVSSESEMFEGYMLAYQTPDDVVVLGLAATYTGEFDAEFEATATAILDNMEINITADDLMTMMNQ